ncbi:MAG: hypothetical protein JSW50_06460, partial [Candidatus Latescibacterota bacterium]
VENVELLGLCSSEYEVAGEFKEVFTGPILTWKDLATRYNDDEILLRADAVYQRQRPFKDFGRHSSTRLTGSALLEAYRGGAGWWVGRGDGGIEGNRFKEDLRTGRWRNQSYEVNTMAEGPPSPNYFKLKEFFEAVKGMGE